MFNWVGRAERGKWGEKAAEISDLTDFFSELTDADCWTVMLVEQNYFNFTSDTV